MVWGKVIEISNLTKRTRTCAVGIEGQIWLYLCLQLETVFLMWQKMTNGQLALLSLYLMRQVAWGGQKERHISNGKQEEVWCCFLGWDIGYPRSIDWLGICFFIQQGREVTWNFDDLVGICLAVWRRSLYSIMSPEGHACPGHRVVVGSRIHGVLGRSSEQPVLWKVLGASHFGKKSAQSETGHPHPSCNQQIKVCVTVPTLGCSEPTRWAISHLTVATGISWQRAQVPVIHEQELTHRTHLYTVDETLESLNCSNFFFSFMYLF